MIDILSPVRSRGRWRRCGHSSLWRTLTVDRRWPRESRTRNARFGPLSSGPEPVALMTASGEQQHCPRQQIPIVSIALAATVEGGEREKETLRSRSNKYSRSGNLVLTRMGFEAKFPEREI